MGKEQRRGEQPALTRAHEGANISFLHARSQRREIVLVKILEADVPVITRGVAPLLHRVRREVLHLPEDFPVAPVRVCAVQQCALGTTHDVRAVLPVRERALPWRVLVPPPPRVTLRVELCPRCMCECVRARRAITARAIARLHAQGERDMPTCGPRMCSPKPSCPFPIPRPNPAL